MELTIRDLTPCPALMTIATYQHSCGQTMFIGFPDGYGKVPDRVMFLCCNDGLVYWDRSNIPGDSDASTNATMP